MSPRVPAQARLTALYRVCASFPKRKGPASIQSSDRLDLKAPQVFHNLRPPKANLSIRRQADEADLSLSAQPPNTVRRGGESRCEIVGVEEHGLWQVDCGCCAVHAQTCSQKSQTEPRGASRINDNR